MTDKLQYHHEYLDRYGRPRSYFRWRGRNYKLPPKGDPTFYRAYGALLERVRAGTLGPAKVSYIKGTVAWVVDAFMQHDRFTKRKPGTRKNYKLTLESLRSRMGDCLFSDFTPMNIRALRDKVRGETATSTADNMVAMIGILWDFAAEHCQMQIGINPARDVAKVHTDTHEHEPWPADVIERFEAVAKPPLRLALYLMLYTGQRAGDVLLMRWDDIVGSKVLVRQEKTDARLAIPIHSKLVALLDQTPRINERILTSNWKRPYKDTSTLNHAIGYVLDRIGAKGFTQHGLRKNAGNALAEAGCTENEIMAVLGHRSSKMAQLYVRQANRGKLAESAMQKREAAK